MHFLEQISFQLLSYKLSQVYPRYWALLTHLVDRLNCWLFPGKQLIDIISDAGHHVIVSTVLIDGSLAFQRPW